MTDTAIKTTGIGIIFGMWTRYEVYDAKASDFHSRYDAEEYTDVAFPMMTIIWDDRMEEIDSDSEGYPPFPAEWTKGVACLEASYAYFEVEGEITSVDQITVKNVNIIVNDVEYDADDWDMQEIEEAIDIATGKQVDLWV